MSNEEIANSISNRFGGTTNFSNEDAQSRVFVHTNNGETSEFKVSHDGSVKRRKSGAQDWDDTKYTLNSLAVKPNLILNGRPFVDVTGF